MTNVKLVDVTGKFKKEILWNILRKKLFLTYHMKYTFILINYINVYTLPSLFLNSLFLV